MNQKTMMTDLYELTMSQTYFQDGKKDEIVYFDSFFRSIPNQGGYALMGGNEEIVEYIKNFHFTKDDIEYLRSTNLFTEEFLSYLRDLKFTGDIYMVPTGTPVFPNEPIITVRAKTIEAQIIETTLLSYLNAGIKFTTCARKLKESAGEIPIMEFGARRADGPDAAIMASKYAYIAGCSGTSNVYAGKKYQIPVMGTMAHSFITDYEDEYEAFLAYAKMYPENSVFLVDTYNTLKSGVPNAIRVAKDYLIPNGYRLKGIRIDSGDLAYETKMARKMLDEAGMQDTIICISNGLTSKTINSLKEQGACFDSIGAGDHITAPNIRIGCVYKLAGLEENKKIIPKIKISNDKIKTTNPGYKKVYRFYDKKTGYALGDVITVHHEKLPMDEYTLIDPENRHNKKTIRNYEVRELQELVFQNGEFVAPQMSIENLRNHCEIEMNRLYPEIKREEMPHQYYVDLSEELYALKEELLAYYSQEERGKVYAKRKENRTGKNS